VSLPLIVAIRRCHSYDIQGASAHPPNGERFVVRWDSMACPTWGRLFFVAALIVSLASVSAGRPMLTWGARPRARSAGVAGNDRA
jgi:hypothetical protein